MTDRARSALRRPAFAALCAIVLVGALMRLYLLWRWRPAFLGFPDTTIYFHDAAAGIHTTAMRVAGYGLFLRWLHTLRAHLTLTIAVQHLLGLAAGVLLFLAVRRSGVREWAGLVPAAVVILGGSEILLEHAPLTEALFIFLMSLFLYTAMRQQPGTRAVYGWSAFGGLVIGCASVVRLVALAVAPVALLVVLVAGGGTWRERAVRVALAAAVAAVPIGWYLHDQRAQSGIGGFTADGNFDLYGRVAPFADCHRFHPPAGTARLCITTPRSQRPGPNYWEFTINSPAVKAYAEPDESTPQKSENAQLAAFARAAILAQPLDYLEYVGRDLWRLVNPGSPSSPYRAIGNAGYGDGPQDLVNAYFTPAYDTIAMESVGAYYPGDGEVHRSIQPLLDYERLTRVTGIVFVLLLVLALAAPPLSPRGRIRYAAWLFLASALVMLIVPPLVAHYEYRFAIPAFGPLAAAAGIGLAGAVERRRRPRPQPASTAGSGAVAIGADGG
jgi:hypothetical protein